MDALRISVYGTSVRDWLVALGVALVVLIALRLVRGHLARRFARQATGAHGDLVGFVAELVRRSSPAVLIAIALFIGALLAELPAGVERVVRTAMVCAVLFQVAVWLNRTISFLLTRHFSRALDEDAGRATALTFVTLIARFALWIVVLLVALGNLGVDITALVAGLGIGGIAVALATQNILGDVFASLAIVLDRPFVVGDYIVVDTLSGHVEHIGLKTTRVRSLSGEQIVFANSELLKSRVRNYQRTWERRVVFSVGVSYQTAHAKLARIPVLIREIVEAQEPARFERAHFARLADSALVFDVVYYVLRSDETTFMDVQQAINLALFARFQREGIDFAAPARALEVRETAAAVLPRSA